MVALVNDLSTLTTLSVRLLEKLNKTSVSIIGHAVYESLQCGEQITSVDIGYGVLSINIDNESIRYRFVPSKELERTINNAALNKSSPIRNALDNKLAEKLKNTYREII